MTQASLFLAALAPSLKTRCLGQRTVFLQSCASTSDEVAARAATGAEEGLLVVADQQTGGRGRRGRQWHSPAGENLYFSLLLRPTLPAHEAVPLTLVAGAALAETIAALGLSPRLKWPNDVLLDTPGGVRKVAGILTEMATEGARVRHVVLGIGVNINSHAFPPPLDEVATSLAIVKGASIDRAEVLAGFLNLFEPIYDDFVKSGPAAGLAAWSRHALLGQRCWAKREGGPIVEGEAVAIDATGALRVRTDDGRIVALHAGEINWGRP